MMDVYFSQAEAPNEPNELVSTRDVEFIGCQLRFFFFPSSSERLKLLPPRFSGGWEALPGIPMPTIAMQMC